MSNEDSRFTAEQIDSILPDSYFVFCVWTSISHQLLGVFKTIEGAERFVRLADNDPDLEGLVIGREHLHD